MTGTIPEEYTHIVDDHIDYQAYKTIRPVHIVGLRTIAHRFGVAPATPAQWIQRAKAGTLPNTPPPMGWLNPNHESPWWDWRHWVRWNRVALGNKYAVRR